MFNSFLDGSKPAIECTAVCNATGLVPPPDGLTYPPASIDDIPSVCRPIAEGGALHQKGQVEVISSLTRDGHALPYDIRFGVFVVFEGETEYIRNCFKEYMVRTDPSGRYACLYKRWHLIGLEVGISVAAVGLRRESTGAAVCFNADVVATAKRDLQPGEILVAPQTDPSWTPLFMVSSGVVVDVGAMGSHAMIISRELGIPCAAGVTDATRRITTGATVEVDGSTGT